MFKIMRFRCADVQGPHDRWGDTAPPVRGAPARHNGAEAGTGSQDPLTGEKHTSPLSHGQSATWQFLHFIKVSLIYRTLRKKIVLGGFKMKCDSAVTNAVIVKID